MTRSRANPAPSEMDWLGLIKPRAAVAELPPFASGVTTSRIERRNLAMRQRVVERVRAEYHEMPGLSLTLPQARRLFGIPQDACARILEALTREGLLRCEADGRFARCDARP